MPRLFPALLLFAPCVPLACGPAPTHHTATPTAHADPSVQSWDGSAQLQRHKQAIVDTLRAQGASDARVALVLACAMAETPDIAASQRDASKDGAGDAKNFSAFNMNAFALKKLGWSEGQGVDINQDDNLPSAVKLFNQGLEALGQDRWLCLHRGGETALNDGVSYGAQDYIRAVRAVAAYLLADPARFTSPQRFGLFIEHV